MKNTLFNRSVAVYEDAMETAQHRAVAELLEHVAIELVSAARLRPGMTVQDAAEMLLAATKEVA